MFELASKTIVLRLVEESDAEFILSLRVDSKYNRYLSQVSDSIADQRKWIINYKDDEKAGKQYYFIIERYDGTPCGTVRLYDFREESFCWGSWILNENKTPYSALESAILVYKFAFEYLGYSKSHFEVRKENDKVISFHKKMGACQIGEDELNYYFTISAESVSKFKAKFSHLI